MEYRSFPGGPHEPTLLRISEKLSFACKWVVILDTGDHISCHPMDIKMNKGSNLTKIVKDT